MSAASAVGWGEISSISGSKLPKLSPNGGVGGGGGASFLSPPRAIVLRRKAGQMDGGRERNVNPFSRLQIKRRKSRVRTEITEEAEEGRIRRAKGGGGSARSGSFLKV